MGAASASLVGGAPEDECKASSSPSTEACEGARRFAKGHIGKAAVSVRYHRLPKKFEDHYTVINKTGDNQFGVVKLGSGRNGTVFLAHSKVSSEHCYAVKKLDLEALDDESKEQVQSEAGVLLAMDHPHVVRLVDMFETPLELNVVMECMTGGTLAAQIKELVCFKEPHAVDVCHQMLQALRYLHLHHIAHRDLTPANLMYESKERKMLKLIDFGLSRFFTPQEGMEDCIGSSMAYVAPEVLQSYEGRHYNSKCDVWSAGVITFEMLVGYLPFRGSSQNDRTLKSAIIRGRLPEKGSSEWKELTPDACDFVRRSLVVKPHDRLSSSGALEHKWFVDFAQRANSLCEGEKSETVELTTRSLANFKNQSAAWRAVTSIMAWSLHPEDRKKVRDQFELLDTDNSGSIGLGEFRSVVTSTYGLDVKAADQAFYDVVGDGEAIQYHQFLAATVGMQVKPSPEVLRATFQRFDAEDQGFVTIQDLRHALGRTYEGSDVLDILDALDTDGDGKIEFEEFTAFMTANITKISDTESATTDMFLLSAPNGHCSSERGDNHSRTSSKLSAMSLRSTHSHRRGEGMFPCAWSRESSVEREPHRHHDHRASHREKGHHRDHHKEQESHGACWFSGACCVMREKAGHR